MSIRGNVARRRSGGPQYQVLPDRMLVEVQGETSLTELVDEATGEAPSRLQTLPVKLFVILLSILAVLVIVL